MINCLNKSFYDFMYFILILHKIIVSCLLRLKYIFGSLFDDSQSKQ